MLSIEDYNKKENKGKIDLSNRFLRAFRAKLFENGGFPTKVIYEDELYRYIDSMHADSFTEHYNNLCNGITKEEFELLKKCTEKILNMSLSYYDEKLLVKAPMLASICERRLIKSIIGDCKYKRVFEIGGGSGTLGSLLLCDDVSYSSTDVTQAFYLIQNRLYDYILNGNTNEMVTADKDENSKCIHIPYWKLWKERNEPIDIDLVTSNHALLEMNENSLKFYLNYCYEALSKNNGAFVFQGAGWRIDQNLIDLIKLFEEYGYRLQYFDHSKEIVLFSTKGESVKDEVLNELNKLLKSDVVYEKIYALGEHLLSRLDKDKVFKTGDLGNKMYDYLRKYDKLDKIDINDLLKYYDSFNIKNDSPDEEFAEYIKVKKR